MLILMLGGRKRKKKKKKTEIVLDRNFSGSVFLFSEKSYKIVKNQKVEFEIEIEKSFFPFFKNRSFMSWSIFFSFSFGKTFFEPIPKGVIKKMTKLRKGS